jgi:L-ascorbate peroxidase
MCAAAMAKTKYTENGPGTKGGMSWTPEWLKFDNSYFVEVKQKRDEELLVLETDDVLFQDEGFAPYANKYAESQEAFFEDYAKAHKKLSELGVVWDKDGPMSID